MPSIYRSVPATLLLLALSWSPLLAQLPDEEPYTEPSERHQHEEGLEEVDVTAVNPPVHGKWVTLASTMPINPVHVSLMRTGKVLVVAGSGNVRDNRQFLAGEFDPASGAVNTFRVTWDMFCNGIVTLPDGRPLVFGGTIAYDSPGVNFKGEPRAQAYRPVQGGFDPTITRMRRGRWYPTGTVLADGSVMVIAGFDEQGVATADVEVYRPDTGTWVFAGTAPFVPPLYPRQHVLPTGKVFMSGSRPVSRLWDPATRTWVSGPRTLRFKVNPDGTRTYLNRDYGTSVLLPLTPANGFRPTVMIIGGGHKGEAITETTELVDVSNDTPGAWAWIYGPSMKTARVHLNATILPNGKVLVSGGSVKNEDAASAVLTAELYDPVAKTFSDAAPMRYPRLYHSNALLLQDGTVMAVGSNPGRTYQQHIEIYSPPYLFTSTGALAARPVISAAPGAVAYGAPFNVQTPNAGAIRSVVLVRPGAPTHAFDMEQRLVGMTFTPGAGVLNVTAPANRNLAPPGYYLLFILDANGVPSVGRFIKVG